MSRGALWLGFGLALGLALSACRLPGTGGSREWSFTVNLEGNSSFSDAELTKVMESELAEFEEAGGGPAYVDDAAFELETFYRNHGFPFVSVDYDMDGEGASSGVHFEIEEGPRTRVESVEIDGNEAFSDDELTSFVEKAYSASGASDTEGYLVVEAYDQAAAAFEDLYVARGHLDVEAPKPEITFSEDRATARVRFIIEEGVAYTISEIEIEWVGGEPPQAAACREIAKGFKKKPCYPRVDYELRADLRAVFAREGHPDAKVDLERSTPSEPGAVRIVARIDPGPQVIVTSVRFEGNQVTKPRYLKARLEVPEGEPYDDQAIRDGVGRLYSTGLFQRVTTELEPEAGGHALVVTLEEYPTKEFFVEPGYGSYELLRLHLGFRHRNIRGTGLQFRSDATAGLRAQSLRLTLTDPWFLQSEFTADTTTKFERREEPSFTRSEASVGFSVSRDWTERWNSSFGYEFRHSRVNDVDVDDDVDVEDADISALQMTQRYDSRDNFFLPTSGVDAEVFFELADDLLLTGLNFFKTRASLSHALSFGPTTVLATAVRGGIIIPRRDDNSIPIQERFFNGGENTVRSYKESELGPKDDGDDPLGGEANATFNAELRQRLFGSLAGAVFYDAGTVAPEYQDIFDFDGANTGSGVGVGLRYNTPVGPLRLDLGVNPSPNHDEDDYVVHFSIGMAF